MPVTNIHDAPWSEGANDKGDRWKFLDISGQRLGVRLEEMQQGESSSRHHFHTLEEEHVLILEGRAVLILGDEEQELAPGDHVCFAAGEAVPHHLENRSPEPLKLLVFGERNDGDVVVYPRHHTLLIKALGWKSFKYED